jgi:hypothetical protein
MVIARDRRSGVSRSILGGFHPTPEATPPEPDAHLCRDEYAILEGGVPATSGGTFAAGTPTHIHGMTHVAARTWFMTGVSSGFGREHFTQLPDPGDHVVGTNRDLSKVTECRGTTSRID